MFWLGYEFSYYIERLLHIIKDRFRIRRICIDDYL